MIKILSVLLISMCAFTTSFAYCENDYIKSITSDGSVVVLSTDDAWEIDTSDRITTESWSALDNVIVCDNDSIIHKDNGEKVGAQKID